MNPTTRWLEDPGFGGPARRLSVATLTGLRALGAVGQTLAVLVAAFALDLPIPVGPSLAIILASTALTLGVRARFRARRRFDDNWAAALLAFDVAQLSALLALNGGLVNPFSVLLVAPVMTAASALPARRAAFVLALTIVAATAASIWYVPLPLGDGEIWRTPPLIRAGAFIAIAVSATFIAIYAYRVAEESRVLASALAATELALARQQHLSQLDGLAAAAAHELGTPLGTIALVSHEMAGAPGARAAFGDDLALLEKSARQCRDILAKLSHPQEMARGGISETPMSSLLEEIAAPRRLSGVEIAIHCAGEGPEPIVARNAGALFALGNIVENGVGHANAKVTIDAAWSASAIVLAIADDGPGFPPSALERVGEPYISTPVDGDGEDGGGMGLGLFIAIALLARSGASVAFSNAPGGGARADVTWPRGTIESGRRGDDEGL